MNSRNIETNESLQKVGAFLLARRRASTREISMALDVYAVNSIIAELRDNGWKIHCEREGRHYNYTLISPGRGAQICRGAA